MHVFADGNGFKTSTMRLGADVIVFSRATTARYFTRTIFLEISQGLCAWNFL